MKLVSVSCERLEVGVTESAGRQTLLKLVLCFAVTVCIVILIVILHYKPIKTYITPNRCPFRFRASGRIWSTSIEVTNKTSNQLDFEQVQFLLPFRSKL